MTYEQHQEQRDQIAERFAAAQQSWQDKRDRDNVDPWTGRPRMF